MCVMIKKKKIISNTVKKVSEKNSVIAIIYNITVRHDCPKLDSNQRPQSFQPCALPTELLGLKVYICKIIDKNRIQIRLRHNRQILLFIY